MKYYIFKYLKKNIFLLFLSILFSFFYGFLSAIFLSLIQPLFDKIIFSSSFSQYSQNKNTIVVWLLNSINSYLDFKDPIEGLKKISIFILLVGTLKCITYFLQYYLSSLAGQLTIRSIRQDLYNHLWELPLDFFSKEHTGNILSRFNYDLTNLEQAISKGVRDIFINIFEIVIFFTVLFGLDYKLTLVVLLCAPIIFFPVVKLSNKMRGFTKNLQNKMSDINIVLQETITGIRIVRAFNMEEKEIERFKNENEDYLKFGEKISKIISLQVPIIEVLFTLIAVGILGYGGMHILDGQLTSGEFFMYFGTLLAITPRFGVLSRVYGIFQSGIAGMEHVVKIFETKPSISDRVGSIEHILDKDITYKNVSFGYDPSRLILKDISLSIKKGEMIAVVGPSGAGKTTLVDLLPRFYLPTTGTIEIDGIDIHNISIASLRNQIGIVTQDTFLFHDTIENNIRYGKLTASLDEIKQAAQKAHALDFIESFPEKFKTIVGERGTQLSGGQRQRLSIARVILKNPPILILDEATSSLDSESELEVQKAMDILFSNRTTIVIAHRLSTIRHANRIVLVDKGNILDIGTHDELIERSPLYRELYELQFIK